MPHEPTTAAPRAASILVPHRLSLDLGAFDRCEDPHGHPHRPREIATEEGLVGRRRVELRPETPTWPNRQRKGTEA